jgi:hypothetical protein
MDILGIIGLISVPLVLAIFAIDAVEERRQRVNADLHRIQIRQAMERLTREGIE